MARTRSSLFRFCVIVLLAVAAASGVASAQYGRGKSADSGNNPLTATLIKTGLYVFAGETNSVVRLTANGAIVVDGQTAPASHDALVRQIRRISELPVRLLITTDHHQEHTGSNARFLDRRVQILAQDNVLMHLRTNGDNPALPTRTYDRELAVRLGGVEVQVMHFGAAHTDGDTVVYFPNLRVVAVGDLFVPTPNPDFAAGGSLVNWATVLSHVLKLDFDVVVPGRGPAGTRADLEAFRGRISSLVSRGTELVKSGVPKDQLLSRLQTINPAWRLTLTGTDLDTFYTELSPAK